MQMLSLTPRRDGSEPENNRFTVHYNIILLYNMAKTRKVGKKRKLVKKHNSRRYAKGKKNEISFLLKTMLNDVHTRTYGQEFVDPGNPSLVSHIVSHLLPSEEDRQLEKRVVRLEKEVAQRKHELILDRVQAEEDFLNQKNNRGRLFVQYKKEGKTTNSVISLQREVEDRKRIYGPPRSNNDIYYEWWDTLFTRVDILLTNAKSNEDYAYETYSIIFNKW
jgi:hypothetical protein